MAFARVVWWKIKPGMREEAVKRMDPFRETTKATNGYLGLVQLLSMSNPDRITIVTFWDSEDAMNAVQSGVFQKVIAALSDIIEGPPQVANQEVRAFDMPKILA
jgi:quinol monooxygenase YgiN